MGTQILDAGQYAPYEQADLVRFFFFFFFLFLNIDSIISRFPVGYREVSVKIPIFMFLLPRLIALASQPDRNMTSFT